MEDLNVTTDPSVITADTGIAGYTGEKGKRAKALFLQGYNCCQAVVVAFAEEMGLDCETVMRLACGFGGGLGRMRETCGTVSGMVLVAGMLRGYSSPTDQEEKKRTYAMIQKLVKGFQAKNGSVVCRELLGLPSGASDPSPELRTESYYKKRPCAELAECAANLVEAFLAEEALAEKSCSEK